MATDPAATPTAPRVPPHHVVPQRVQFHTTNPDEARHFVGTMYAAQPHSVVGFDAHLPMSISQVSAGGVSSVDFTMPPDLTLHLEGTDDLSVTHFVQGRTHAEYGRVIERFDAGDVSLGTWPGGRKLIRCHQLRVQILTVPGDALAQAAGALSGDKLPPLRFERLAPVSRAAQAHWKRSAAVARGVLDEDQTAASSLIVGSVRRLLATTALAVFPNNLVSEHGLPTLASPVTVRRAEEYLHAHAHTDVGVADVAAACHVSPRALQYAFARHHQTSPMQYLRRVRLARAHLDLQTADPAAGVTVTAIAAQWGFARVGRFTTAYVAAYGTHPRQTLREDGVWAPGVRFRVGSAFGGLPHPGDRTANLGDRDRNRPTSAGDVEPAGAPEMVDRDDRGCEHPREDAEAEHPTERS